MLSILSQFYLHSYLSSDNFLFSSKNKQPVRLQPKRLHELYAESFESDELNDDDDEDANE